MGTYKKKTSWWKEIKQLALQHTEAEFSGKKAESASMKRSSSPSNERFAPTCKSFIHLLHAFFLFLFFLRKPSLTKESDIQ